MAKPALRLALVVTLVVAVARLPLARAQDEPAGAPPSGTGKVLDIQGKVLDIIGITRGIGGTSRPLSQDVLILRSDETRTGELQTCVAATCTLDSTSVRRDAIAWIGLRGAEPDPPAVRDPAHDEVHLKDSSVHAGQLTFVDRGRVVTERDSYERDKVAWVYLTQPKADEQNHPDQFGAPGDEPPPSGPAVQP